MTDPMLNKAQFESLVRAFRRLVQTALTLPVPATHDISHDALPVAVLLFVGKDAQAILNRTLKALELSDSGWVQSSDRKTSEIVPFAEDADGTPGVN